MLRILALGIPAQLCVFVLSHGCFSIKVRYRVGGASLDFLSSFTFSQGYHPYLAALARRAEGFRSPVE